jgi:sodium-dependent dicarboxylate transporter 2/3/5
MLMSNTATTAMMIAAVTPILSTLGDRPGLRKAFLIGIPAAASVGGMGTIIGSPPNAIAVGALANKGIEINFLEWMYIGFPLAVGLTIMFWFVLVKKFDIKGKYQELNKNEFEFPQESVNKVQYNMVLATIALTILLWLTTPIHGFPVAAISGLPIILLTVSRIISADDVRTLPWDTLMLVAGGLALGVAIIDTGLADIYVGKSREMIESMPLVAILVFLGLITAMLSNIMSNTATSSILIPVAIIILDQHAISAALAIGLSASTALFLQISTPPNAIAFSTGYLKQKDFQFGGLWVGITGPLLIVAFIVILLSLNLIS